MCIGGEKEQRNISNHLEGKWRREQHDSEHSSSGSVCFACRRRGRGRWRRNDIDIGVRRRKKRKELNQTTHWQRAERTEIDMSILVGTC